MDGMGKHGEYTGDLTMPQFILKINLGNEAVSNPYHIQDALKRTAKKIYDADLSLDDMITGPINIHDLNGNVVGSFEVV
jgi:hypothetical protein